MTDLEKQKAYWQGQLDLLRELRVEVLSSSAYRVEFQNRQKYAKRKLQEIAERE